MNCPLCEDQALEPRFSHGIEVDVCPGCKGIWLDRGELERVFSNAAITDTVRPETPGPPPPQPIHQPQSSPPREKPKNEKSKKKRKKKGWADFLEDVFDEVLDL